jgi:hypothetical protein
MPFDGLRAHVKPAQGTSETSSSINRRNLAESSLGKEWLTHLYPQTKPSETVYLPRFRPDPEVAAIALVRMRSRSW